MDLLETIKALDEEIEDDAKFRRLLMRLINNTADIKPAKPRPPKQKPTPGTKYGIPGGPMVRYGIPF